MHANYGVPLLVNFIFALCGGGLLLYRIRMKTKGLSTQATILEFKAERLKDADGIGPTRYYPVLRFITSEGQEITIQHNEGDFRLRKHLIGTTVEIYYIPEAPEKLIIARPPTPEVIFLIIGLTGLTIFLYLSIMNTRVGGANQ